MAVENAFEECPASEHGSGAEIADMAEQGLLQCVLVSMLVGVLVNELFTRHLCC